MTRALSPLMWRVLEVLADEGPLTGNEIGATVGARTVRGNGRVFGAAQQVIPVITALRVRGLIRMERRPDGLSGTADAITPAGRKLLRERER